MKPTSLEDLYAKFTPVAGETPADMQRELGQFDVFSLGNLRPGRHHRPPTPFNRQAFYKISLSHGEGRFEFADHAVEVGPDTLFLATPRTAYRWTVHGEALTGYFCIFTEEFLLPAKGGMRVEELPVFRAGAQPAIRISEAECAAAEAIFEKMIREMATGYAYKYDLLRIYLLGLIHFAQKLQPAPAAALPPAATRVADQFAKLLERQFPPQGPRLRTAKDYADQLAVHVVHLNRVLKEVTGQTTTALIASRITQEAKLLLKQTNQSVSEVADQLGFTDVAHFCTFFKRQSGLTPSNFRR
ncbi:helix-turn-helix domain-containing protein [Hymenobacter psoromatis]|uniref:helix-turn-helix domain-containing protein n=1 Tax=Hymenobacter psoromatis TaxID=1484116 RepID=UPI001CBD75D5|nr:helix-turn-helix transcriptional regulator [Hymenobacter psoromatis]